MAIASIELVNALRETAERLRKGVHYAWGNHGACNCGQLLQVATGLTEQEIIRYAHTANGEWSELGMEFCGNTGVPVGMILSGLEKLGLTATDIHHIEYLTDKYILNNLPGGFRWLKKNQRQDVIVYLETFASLLEDKLLDSIDISNLHLPELKLEPQ